jgi:hypothetical protein
VEYTLYKQGERWPKIDPIGWVIARDYASRDLAEEIEKFMNERAKSITYVESIKQPDWDLAYQHEDLGRIKAGDMMSSWVAHDMLHMRQLAGLQFGFLERQIPPYSVTYAGNW